MNKKKDSSGNHHRKKEREKTILFILGSCTFSHSLDPKQTFALIGRSSTVGSYVRMVYQSWGGLNGVLGRT
jgi:hypothetical protein